MKKLIFSLCFGLIINALYGQIWSETFDEAAGSTSGTGSPSGDWSSTCIGCNTPGFLNVASVFEVGLLGGYFSAGRIDFTGTGMDAEGVWTSPIISISGFTDIKIYLETVSLNTEAGDYLQVYYKLDGGAETLFHTATNGSVTSTGISPALNGTQVQIVVRAFTNGLNDLFTFDNISVTNTLFSRATAAWQTSGTWSAVAIGGADCTCTPSQFTDVVVGGGHTVTIGAAATSATLQINGTADAGGAGTLTYSGNFTLNISRAGSVTVNAGGQITSGGNASAVLAFTDNQSHTITNNGTISIGDLTVTNASLLTPTVITLAGSSPFAITDALSLSESSIQSVTLTNGVIMTIGGAATISNTSTFTNNSTVTFGGAVTLGNVTSTFTNNNTVTMSSTAPAVLSGAGTWTQGANSTLNYAGSTLTVTTLNASNTGNIVSYNAAGAQTIKNPSASTYYHLTLSNGGTKSSSGNHIILGNLSISGTAAFDVNAGSDDISVGGNWTITSTTPDPFVQGTRTVTLNGGAAQTLINSSGETFNNLIINNASAFDIVFNNNVTVTSALTMTNGNVNLNGTILTLSSTAIGALNHAGASTNGWMYGGSFRRTFANTTAIAIGTVRGFFPLGSSVDWRPFFVGVNSIAGTAGTITVSHTNATTTSDVVFPESIVRRHDSFWSVVTSGISAGTWNLRAGGTNFGTIEAGAAGLADLRMSTTTGVVGTHGAATGGPDYRVNRTAVPFADLANNYHVASTDAVNSPLPVELVDFTASVIHDEVELRWVTASELNNDFFTVERSLSGEVFSSIGQVNGRGTTSQAHTYSLVDSDPLSGRSYYRLKQTDFDGTFTYSEIISVAYEGPRLAVMEIYPNPSNGAEITIELKGLREVSTVPVVVYDHLGKEHAQFVLKVDTNSGSVQKLLTFEKPLPGGIYILKAGSTPYLTKRLIVTD